MLAKLLAQHVVKDDEDGFIRIDMSEFQAKHEMSRLIGSPPVRRDAVTRMLASTCEQIERLLISLIVRLAFCARRAMSVTSQAVN